MVLPQQLAIDSQGRVVVGLNARKHVGYSIVVARLHRDGIFDSEFFTKGWIAIDRSDTAEQLNAIGLTSEDRIILIGDQKDSAQTKAAFVGTITESSVLDKNRDGSVSPIDALLVINEINAHGVGPIWDSEVEFLDTNGDNELTAIDALLVINDLNRSAETSAPVPAIRGNRRISIPTRLVDIAFALQTRSHDAVADRKQETP